LKNIKKVGIILRPSTPELKNIYHKIEKIFHKNNIEVYIDSISGGMIDVIGMEFHLLCQESDILVSIGGDGTLISTVRRSFHYDIPVLGVYAGNLGFLADISVDELDDFIPKLASGDFKVDERSVLESRIQREKEEIVIYAFNDIVLTRSSITNMISIETLVGGKAFNTYHGDGVIVSTPTGSTAYNLSAGGPVLFPLTKVFTLTPICPHSLTQRPVVLPGEFFIEMKSPTNPSLMIIDGQDKYEIDMDESVHISLAKKYAKLIHKETFNYFDVLRDKLGWGA